MVFHSKRKKASRNLYLGGFTLIEALVGSAIFLLIALSGYKAFVTLMDAVGASQAKIAATSVANERFEVIRNLPYDDVGLVGGLPVGTVEREETITRNNYVFDLLYTSLAAALPSRA